MQVNIIPIIAKADTIAKNELHKFKSKIMSELVSNGVQIYQFPTDEETVAEINATMSVSPHVMRGFPESFSLWQHYRVAVALDQGQLSSSSTSTANHSTSWYLSFHICHMEGLS